MQKGSLSSYQGDQMFHEKITQNAAQSIFC
jgi:hypothetical protein